MTTEWAAVEGTMEREVSTGSPTSPGGDKKIPTNFQEVYEVDGVTTTISTANQTETRHKADGSKLRIVKRVKSTKIVRPQSMADLRVHWAKFGKGLENEPGLTQAEAPIPFELGALDAEEKKCRDEVQKTMNLSLDAPIKIPQIRKSALATAPVPQAAMINGSSSSPTAADPDAKKSWASASRDKKEAETKPATTAPGQKAKAGTVPNEVIRISNLTDEISEIEIRRLFGPGNELGDIRRVFIAKNKQGERRGFAYVTYGSTRDAQQAVAKMHKRKFKHAVLLVDYGTAR